MEKITILFVAFVLICFLKEGETVVKKPTAKVTLVGGTTDVTAVDAGTDVKITCTQGTGTGDAATSYEMWVKAKVGTGSTAASSEYTHKMTIAETGGDNVWCVAKEGSQTDVLSDKIAVVVTAVPAPTIESTPVATTNTLSVDLGTEVAFKCKPNTGTVPKNAARSWKFFEGTTPITTGITGDTLKVKLTPLASWKDKVIKCNHYNGDGTDESKDSSNTITLTIKEVPEKCTIKADKSPVNYNVGDDVTLTCTKSTVTGPTVDAYKWYNSTSGTDIKGTAATYKYPAVRVHAKYEIQCICTNTQGDGAKSDKLEITVTYSSAAAPLVSLTTLVAAFFLSAFMRQ